MNYIDEPETVKKYFINFAKSKVGQNYTIVEANKLGLDDLKFIKRTLAKAMEEVIYSDYSLIFPKLDFKFFIF